MFSLCIFGSFCLCNFFELGLVVFEKVRGLVVEGLVGVGLCEEVDNQLQSLFGGSGGLPILDGFK